MPTLLMPWSPSATHPTTVTFFLPKSSAPHPLSFSLLLRRPFGVVIGGCKVKDKIKVLHSLIQKADVLCIGGRMAFTFLAAQGVAVGRTQVEEEWLQVLRFYCLLFVLWCYTLVLGQLLATSPS
jgi:hypothetical protein